MIRQNGNERQSEIDLARYALDTAERDYGNRIEQERCRFEEILARERAQLDETEALHGDDTEEHRKICADIRVLRAKLNLVEASYKAKLEEAQVQFANDVANARAELLR